MTKNTRKYIVQRAPFVVPTKDNKIIKEHFGLLSSHDTDISIAFMTAPSGWKEPFQTPKFDEYTYIINGRKQIDIDGDIVVLNPGESIKISKNTRVKYSNPFNEPCEYLAICKPAFSIDTVKREDMDE